MSDERIMETSLTSSQGPRRIHNRRRPTESEKSFRCECGKSYLSNESLYTHRKMKHPVEFARRNLEKQLQEQQEGNHYQDMPIDGLLERDESVKKVVVNNNTFQMLTRSAFLNFFKEMKILADSEKEVMKLFHSEKAGYTNLNYAFLATGYSNHLVYLVRAYRVSQNLTDSREQAFKHTISSRKEDSWLEISLLSPMKAQQTMSRNSETAESELDKKLRSLERVPLKLEDIPEYYRDFFMIAKEIVKPMADQFAIEMCYLFNKLIELSSVQQNLRIQQYQAVNQRELLDLIAKNQAIFKKLSSLSPANRTNIIEKLLFNLAHLFSTGEAVPDD